MLNRKTIHLAVLLQLVMVTATIAQKLPSIVPNQSGTTKNNNTPRVQNSGTVRPASAQQPAIEQRTAQKSIKAPSFIPLSAAHQTYINKVLEYWQNKTAKVDRYRCKFERWQFDTVFGPQNTFKTYSTGLIRYADPDKGMFKVEKVLSYQAPRSPQEKPRHIAIEGVHGEWWVCDGKSVFEYDFTNERLIQQILPAELQGKAIKNGPLPFLFGADAAEIKQRYWLQVITPSNVKDAVWLEAFPKSQADAANYLKVHIIIDRRDFLPKGIVIFDRNFVKGKNHSRTVFNFRDREENFNTTFEALRIWEKNFYEPSLPSGWKKVVNAAPTRQQRQANQSGQQTPLNR